MTYSDTRFCHCYSTAASTLFPRFSKLIKILKFDSLC